MTALTPAALQPCVAAERKFKRKLLWRKYVRVYVINRRIIARRELYAAMLLPDFQADRRIKAMPVVTYKSSAGRPRTPARTSICDSSQRRRCTKRLIMSLPCTRECNEYNALMSSRRTTAGQRQTATECMRQRDARQTDFQ